MASKIQKSGSSDSTRKFPAASERDVFIRRTLMNVYDALAEKGYDPISQLVGYILSEDPAYITNHKGARTLITKIDRDELLDALTRYYFTQGSDF